MENIQVQNELLKITEAKLQAHIDTLNEALNTAMTYRINLILTEKSRQEAFKALEESEAKVKVLELKVIELEETIKGNSSLLADEVNALVDELKHDEAHESLSVSLVPVSLLDASSQE